MGTVPFIFFLFFFFWHFFDPLVASRLAHWVQIRFAAYVLFPLYMNTVFCFCCQSLVSHLPSHLPFYRISSLSTLCPILCLSLSRINSHSFLIPPQDRRNHRFCSSVISVRVCWLARIPAIVVVSFCRLSRFGAAVALEMEHLALHSLLLLLCLMVFSRH